jgi:hypothetical protein
MTPGSWAKDMFGLGPLSPANAGGMLPMLRAKRAARIANFMICVLVPPKVALPLPNLVGLATDIDFMKWSDNEVNLNMIYAPAEIIAHATAS